MISIVISTHGDSHDVPTMLNLLERQRGYAKGIPEHVKRHKPVEFLAGKYLEPFSNHLIEVIVVNHGIVGTSETHEELSNLDDSRIDQVLELPHIPNSYGHHCREAGIKAATGDWIVLTSADNLFMAGWLHHVMQAVRRPQVGMVVWRVVNNYWGWTTGKTYLPGKEATERGWIDMCSVAVRADIAKKIGFPFREFDSDATYILACGAEIKRRRLKTVFLPYVLAVHQ